MMSVYSEDERCMKRIYGCQKMAFVAHTQAYAALVWLGLKAAFHKKLWSFDPKRSIFMDGSSSDRGGFMKNFRFKTICNITQELQDLQRSTSLW